MLSFLFWNINRNSIEEIISRIVHENQIDILILAESKIEDKDILELLNVGEERVYLPAPGIPIRLRIYSRYTPEFIKPIRDSTFLAIRNLTLPLRKDILIVAVHLSSKMYESEEDQLLDCTNLSREIEEAEKLVGHSRTVVIGDFNMNPFEAGFVGAAGFHAIMDKNIAKRGVRKLKGKKYKFFYNPMWNMFGDEVYGPAGTYYYDTGRQVNYFWNMFDQVLIRPELIESFELEELKIIEEVGSIKLSRDYGRPNNMVGSDHFPIVFKLAI